MTSGEQRAYLHVGLQKTGTSYLQSHLWDSPAELAEQGVRMVPPSRARAFHLTQALVAEDPSSLAPGPARALDDLRDEVAAAQEPVLLVSQESLSGASAEQAAVLREVFAGREVHVVMTVSDLARQLPSAWQQRLKSRGRTDLPEFVDSVRERAPGSASFWRHHDVVAVLDRWSRDLPPEQVHVVTSPPDGAPPETLARRFGSVVGVDFTRLHAEDLRANVSLDPIQAEMLRRLNTRGRVFDKRATHARMVKQVLAGQVLAPRRSGSLRTPPEAAGFCHEVAEQQITFIRERGYAVSGDLADLCPADDAFGTGEPVTDAQVADAALDAVAELLRRLERAQRAAARSARRSAGQAPQRPPGPRLFRRRG